MSGYMYLEGADDVQRAANTMQAAAIEMSRAAMTIEAAAQSIARSVERLELLNGESHDC